MKMNLAHLTRPLLATSLLFAAACSNAGHNPTAGDKAEATDLGKLSLPLSTQGASGTEYRLRNAEFSIMDAWTWEDPTFVSSEDEPEAASITVNLAEGEYAVSLAPGWELHKLENGVDEVVEATLLSQEMQWVYVQRQGSTFARFEFGLGEQSIWLNGDLNIDIQVYEDPAELTPVCYEVCDEWGCWVNCDGPMGAQDAGVATPDEAE